MEFLLILLALPLALSFLFGFSNSSQWKMALSFLLFRTTDGPILLPPSVGRKWVEGADSSHTEISVIAWLRVTRTPQWQQLLINPTSHHPALPIGGFSPKLFLPNFFLCFWLHVMGCCSCGGDFSDCSLSTYCSVVCRTTVVTGWHCCHFSTLLMARLVRSRI